MKWFMLAVMAVLAVGCAAQKPERVMEAELRNGVGLEGEWTEPELETVEKALSRMERAMGKQVMDLSVKDDPGHFHPREDSHRHADTMTACFRAKAFSAWQVVFERVKLYYDRRPEAREAWRKTAGDVYGKVQEAETGGWRWKDGGREAKDGIIDPLGGLDAEQDRAVYAAAAYASLMGSWSPLDAIKPGPDGTVDSRYGQKLALLKEDGVLTAEDYQALVTRHLTPAVDVKSKPAKAATGASKTADGSSPLVGGLIIAITLLAAGAILVWRFRRRRTGAPAELPPVEEVPPVEPGADVPPADAVEEAMAGAEAPAGEQPVEEPRA